MFIYILITIKREEKITFADIRNVGKLLDYMVTESASNPISKYEKIEQNERKILRELGVKFGRYHVFLYQLIKPEAVSLRTLLWKNFHQKFHELKPPTFGLNFLDDKNDYYDYVVQKKPLGTGHALLQAVSKNKEDFNTVLVLSGDNPLIRSNTLQALEEYHISELNMMTILTTEISNDSDFGRIIRDSSGNVKKIIEVSESTNDFELIKEGNSGIYCFQIYLLVPHFHWHSIECLVRAICHPSIHRRICSHRNREWYQHNQSKIQQLNQMM